MPYVREGAMKISDHHVRSPLLNVASACQTCHRFSEEELRARVFRIQDRTYEMRNLAIDAVLDLTRAIAAAQRAGAPADRLAAARDYQRKAQFFTDFVEAENSMGFHADQEAARILANAVNYARLGQSALRGEPATPPRRLPAPEQLVAPAAR
jgi:nitrite reductase (cytochrome c-552)